MMTTITETTANNLTPANTRAFFYARKNGGGYRTARSEFSCEQFGCLRKIVPGVTYFDTRETTTWPKTKRICACCAEENLK